MSQCMLFDKNLDSGFSLVERVDLVPGLQPTVEASASKIGRCRNLYRPEMKATLKSDDQLSFEAKALATHQRTSLTPLIEEGLHPKLRAQILNASSHEDRIATAEGTRRLGHGWRNAARHQND